MRRGAGGHTGVRRERAVVPHLHAHRAGLVARLQRGQWGSEAYEEADMPRREMRAWRLALAAKEVRGQRRYGRKGKRSAGAGSWGSMGQLHLKGTAKSRGAACVREL
ncbi:hypothetical protein ERJ75_000793700 [Trypanosoma vivax]|nr:hypothetical protein ERJ75_000793700 [Trypanosoma vivax]